MYDVCRTCGEDTRNNWFDREICPEPCDTMHTRCCRCGVALGGCYWGGDHGWELK